MAFRHFRVEFDYLLEVLQRTVEFAFQPPDKTTIVINLRQPWIEPERLAEVAERALQIIQPDADVASIAVWPRLTRVERDGAVEITQRLLIVFALKPDHAASIE